MSWKKIRHSCGMAVGVAAVLYVGLSIGAAMKGMTVSDLYAIGKYVVEARASRHTVADRVATIEAKKPQLKSVAESAGGKLRILSRRMTCETDVTPNWRKARFPGIPNCAVNWMSKLLQCAAMSKAEVLEAYVRAHTSFVRIHPFKAWSQTLDLVAEART